MDIIQRTSGFGSPAEAYAMAGVDWNQIILPKAHAMYGFIIEGSLLEKQGLYNGDIAIVDYSRTPQAGDLIAFIEEGEFLVAKLAFSEGQLVKVRGDRQSRLCEDSSVIGVISRLIRLLDKP